MNLTSIPSILSVLACLALGGFVYSRNPKRPANIGFALGMGSLALTEFSAFMVAFPDDVIRNLFWVKVSIVGQAFFPGSWFLFSLTFARANTSDTIRRQKLVLAGFFLIPLCFLGFIGSPLFLTPLHPTPLPPNPLSPYLQIGTLGYFFYLILLLSMVIILMNLEQTFRSSSGLARLQIKYMIIGTGAILALKIYEAGQILLFSAVRFDTLPIHSSSLLIANALIFFFVVHYKLLDTDIFVSRFILFRSLTLLLAGVYLILVGLVVFGIQKLGGEAYLHLIPLLIFVSLLGLVVLFLSDRLRRKLKTFILSHFYRSRHDYRVKWPEFSRLVGTKLTLSDLLPSYTSWLADTIGTDEVSIWLLDPGGTVFSEQCLVSGKPQLVTTNSPFAQFLGRYGSAVLVEEMQQDAEWLHVVERCGDFLSTVNGSVYLPIRTGREMIGFVSLGRKTTGASYDFHDSEFLMTVADQTAGQIERVRLSEDLSTAREMEAFHTLSSFFVHDLKNHTASLSLLAQNAAIHGDNPEFQKDAFKTIRETAAKMDQLIKHVSVASKGLVLSRSEIDLNRLVATTCSDLNGVLRGQIHSNLGNNLPRIPADPDQLSTVLRNFLINACEAIDETGEVNIETHVNGDKVVFSISDNGCGMSAEFIATSLFKPLRTTKPSGWGIGLFQCQQVIKAHGGRITVESEEGKGSTFTVELPIGDGA